MKKFERIFAEEVASILSIPLRSVQAMAVQGRIPSAMRLGRRWTFNEAAVRAFVKSEEARCQREGHLQNYTGRVVFTGVTSCSPVDDMSFERCTQTLAKLRKDIKQKIKLGHASSESKK